MSCDICDLTSLSFGPKIPPSDDGDEGRWNRVGHGRERARSAWVGTRSLKNTFLQVISSGAKAIAVGSYHNMVMMIDGSVLGADSWADVQVENHKCRQCQW